MQYVLFFFLWKMQQEAQGLASSKASELKLSRGEEWYEWYFYFLWMPK